MEALLAPAHIVKCIVPAAGVGSEEAALHAHTVTAVVFYDGTFLDNHTKCHFSVSGPELYKACGRLDGEEGLESAPFIPERIPFTSSEQVFQYSKALYFKDNVRAAVILTMDDPLLIQKEGNKVLGFSSAVWEEVSFALMKLAVKAKFAGCPEALAQLNATGDAVILEAGMGDWGVGMGEAEVLTALSQGRDPTLPFPKKNRMGVILQQVREELCV